MAGLPARSGIRADKSRSMSQEHNPKRRRENIDFFLSLDYFTPMKYLSLILALTLAACGGVPEMVKPGLSQQESAKDRFECLRNSQTTSSWSLFGIGSSQVTNDSDVYRSCMEARGYVVK
jgi:hypothetical protein